MGGRLEINFQRLLSRCENMAGDEVYLRGAQSWRMEQYLATLQTQMSQLVKAGGLNSELLAAYEMKLNVLKGLVDVEKLKTTPEKTMAMERLPRAVTGLTPPGQTSSSTAGRQAQQKASSRHLQDMRADLMPSQDMRANLMPSQTSTSSELTSARQDVNSVAPAPGQAGLRFRGTDASDLKEMEETIRRHRERQEEIAEEMIDMARQLKESQLADKAIIEEDKKTLRQAEDNAVANREKLKQETERLQEHTRKLCSFWMWFMILAVVAAFLAMVIFIRIVPKPRS